MSFFVPIKRRHFASLFASLISLALLPTLPHAQEATTIKLGTMAGEETDVWKVAAEVARRDGLNIEIVEFSDYAIPNEALNAGDLDANAFQHQPYLDAQIEQRSYDLTVAGYTTLFPIGVYSRKIKDLSELRDGALVGLPDDPSNEGRALRLLAQLELISLDDPNNIMVTPLNVTNNPKNLQFHEMDAGMVGRAIDDFDIAIVNTNWAKTTGLDSEKDVIAREKAENNPYNNIIVVRTRDRDAPWVQKLVAAYQSEEVRAALGQIFGPYNIATSW